MGARKAGLDPWEKAVLGFAALRSDLRKLALVERRGGVGLVQSHPKNNSQTIHCGDIETNYTLRVSSSPLAPSLQRTCLAFCGVCLVLSLNSMNLLYPLGFYFSR